jgi:DNA-directed RNA polymerase specialized sigma24 family protein
MTDRKGIGSYRPDKDGNNDAFLEWLEQVPDPRERYRRATEELERHQQAMERLSSLRAAAVADAYDSGETIRSLAEEFNVSPARVHQIIQTASGRPTEAPGQGRRSRRRKGENK